MALHVHAEDVTAAPEAPQLDLAQRRLLAHTSPAGLGVVASPCPGPYMPAAYHVLLARRIVDLIEGRLDLLACGLPVQSGKTDLASVLTSAFFLGLHPERFVACASYSTEFASDRIGKNVRNLLERYGPELYNVGIDPTSSSRSRFNTTAGGGMVALGIDAGLAGRRGDLILIDDPYASVDLAMSSAHRQRVWDWYTYEIASRMSHTAGTILAMARWTDGDFYSQLVAHFRQSGLRVAEVAFPALAVCSDCGDYGVTGVNACGHSVRDSLGRLPGEALWPEGGRDRDHLLRQLGIMGTRPFSALYQASPFPETGQLFQRPHFKYAALDATNGTTLLRPQGAPYCKLEDCVRIQIVDLAISRSAGADFFVILTAAIDPRMNLTIVDVVREKATAQKQIELVKAAFAKWRPIRIGIECVGYQESFLDLVRGENIPVVELKPKGDKVSRAHEASALYESGRIFHLAGAPWLDVLESELLAFPTGSHDDQADCVSYAGIALNQLAAQGSRAASVLFKGALPGGMIRLG